MSGDMYIRDLRNTKGHISPCTHAQWHPTDKFTGMTSSEDGSIRVWDTWNVLQKTVIKPQLAKPGRIAVTACAYNHDGGLIGGGMFDGTLQIWDVKGASQKHMSYLGTFSMLFHSYVIKLQLAKLGRIAVTACAYNHDGGLIGGGIFDGTLQVWDVKGAH